MADSATTELDKERALQLKHAKAKILREQIRRTQRSAELDQQAIHHKLVSYIKRQHDLTSYQERTEQRINALNERQAALKRAQKAKLDRQHEQHEKRQNRITQARLMHEQKLVVKSNRLAQRLAEVEQKRIETKKKRDYEIKLKREKTEAKQYMTHFKKQQAQLHVTRRIALRDQLVKAKKQARSGGQDDIKIALQDKKFKNSKRITKTLEQCKINKEEHSKYVHEKHRISEERSKSYLARELAARNEKIAARKALKQERTLAAQTFQQDIFQKKQTHLRTQQQLTQERIQQIKLQQELEREESSKRNAITREKEEIKRQNVRQQALDEAARKAPHITLIQYVSSDNPISYLINPYTNHDVYKNVWISK